MPLDTLKKAVVFGLKENLHLQFVYPEYVIPEEYEEVIDTIGGAKIKSIGNDADIQVTDNWPLLLDKSHIDGIYVIRTSFNDFFENCELLKESLARAKRINVVFTDLDKFKDEDFLRYRKVLDDLAKTLKGLLMSGLSPQLNLISDRMVLDKMNNCGAGDTTITLGPDGKFYICPSYYFNNQGGSIGDLDTGIQLKNPQLFKINYAPLCRICDAYQCKRCVWLNELLTWDVNTPSHQQCITAHAERESSRKLLNSIYSRKQQIKHIKKLNYYDPLEHLKDYEKKRISRASDPRRKDGNPKSF